MAHDNEELFFLVLSCAILWCSKFAARACYTGKQAQCNHRCQEKQLTIKTGALAELCSQVYIWLCCEACLACRHLNLAADCMGDSMQRMTCWKHLALGMVQRTDRMSCLEHAWLLWLSVHDFQLYHRTRWRCERETPATKMTRNTLSSKCRTSQRQIRWLAACALPVLLQGKAQRFPMQKLVLCNLLRLLACHGPLLNNNSAGHHHCAVATCRCTVSCVAIIE